MDRFYVQKVVGFFIIYSLAACSGNNLVNKAPGSCRHHDGKLRAGFAAFEITPLVIEGYIDADGDHHFDGPGKMPRAGEPANANSSAEGETQIDTDGDGIWEPHWIAGFSTGRAAQGVHDPLWARTLILERDGKILTFTSLDLVGVLPTRMKKIRAKVRASVGSCFDLKDEDIVIASTHTHESPDSMGYWGEYPLKSGIVPEYMEYIEDQTNLSIQKALDELTPVSVKFGYASAATWINDDSRFPIVIDDDIITAQFLTEEGTTLGTLIEYSMHPEVLWSQNTQITSDFPHYVRQYVEQELGGIAVYASGMVGGLMTPLSDVHTFEQAELVGKSLADSALASLKDAKAITDCELDVESKTLVLPIANGAFRILIEQSVFDATADDIEYDLDPVCNVRGCIPVPVVAANLCGVAQIATVPGELFPELAKGGYDQPVEFDGDQKDAPPGLPLKKSLSYSDAPTETTIRAEMMDREFKFVFGLANGELGYIVPKSQWDTDDYEETVSLGPDTAPRLHAVLEELFASLRQ